MSQDITDSRREKFEKSVAKRQLDCAVIMENVHDPHNLGAVLRTCDSVGISDVYVIYTEDQLGEENIEAGMSKLLAARIAWSNADNALQIHGGNGYAFEYPISRVLCDARILNIFEGAAEIQAQVIARGLLARRN